MQRAPGGRSPAEIVRRSESFKHKHDWAPAAGRSRATPNYATPNYATPNRAARAVAKRENAIAERGSEGAGARPREWVDPYAAYDTCGVSAAEYAAALAIARKDLLEKKKPVAAGKTPHLIITIGAPGAGKSTVSEAVAAERGAGDYVTIDLDVAVKYHPRYLDIWTAPSAVTNRPTEVGFTLKYLDCNSSLESMLLRIYDELVYDEGPRYNIILQSHAHLNIVFAKTAGYWVSLLFVGVPLHIAQARSRRRAINTGKFLAPNLLMQDELVESMWLDYRMTAVWYGMWADEFLVADNRRNARSDKSARKAIVKNLKEIPLHDKDWTACRLAAQAAVDAACAL